MSDFKMAILENIATMTIAALSAYFISPWCFLLLVNLNMVKTRGGAA